MAVHHVNGCRQMQITEFDSLANTLTSRAERARRRGGAFPLLPNGYEWTNPYREAVLKVVGPKPGCVDDIDKVTCGNCLSKLCSRLRKELR